MEPDEMRLASRDMCDDETWANTVLNRSSCSVQDRLNLLAWEVLPLESFGFVRRERNSGKRLEFAKHDTVCIFEKDDLQWMDYVDDDEDDMQRFQQQEQQQHPWRNRRLDVDDDDDSIEDEVDSGYRVTQSSTTSSRTTMIYGNQYTDDVSSDDDISPTCSIRHNFW